MRWRRAMLLAGVGLLLLVALAAALLWRQVSAIDADEAALVRWRAQGIRHYEVLFRTDRPGPRPPREVLLEVRNGRIVRSVDMDTGAEVPADDLEQYGSLAHINRYLELLDQRDRRELTWRERVARLIPPLADQLQVNCNSAPPAVTFHPELGYPQRVQNSVPCAGGGVWYIEIVSLTPLD